ncbi:uncharacterized protein PAC_17451 [Phialocephala subalpina]|uniref:Zn(2)-C6 fungal-type domain-containing protein n=1 Tax=Phialocephala subalpina TaxID=576137 RepID=A0A1L7XR70_9HELO|nr:uncharacterized protein PAC_17451 [Phialocephala subalpina]
MEHTQTSTPKLDQLQDSSRIAHACIVCRQRKVRCDLKSPCSGCVKAGRPCIRPATARKRSRKTSQRALEAQEREEALLKRLHKLESVVEALRSSTLATNRSDLQDSHDDTLIEDEHERINQGKAVRLLAGNGRSRYVSDRFWASLSAEIEDVSTMLPIVQQLNDGAGSAGSSPESNAASSSFYHGFLFPAESPSASLVSSYPSPSLLPVYWHLFSANVDPLVRIIHKPSVEPRFLGASDETSNLSAGEDALFFSICFSVITSMSDDEVATVMSEGKQTLLLRYTQAIQLSLSQAGFLDTQELVVLQAFVLYLFCLHSSMDTQIGWTLSGLALRIAEGMGLHRDGDVFRLPPFETEMRRRLWWSIYTLDNRACERQGFASKITEESFDTQLPLNIIDADINVNDVAHPTPKTGCTESSFCLIRYKLAATTQYLRNPRYSWQGRKYPNCIGATVTERKRKVEECEQRLRTEHLDRCSHSTSVCRITNTVGRIVIAKMWLELYHPLHYQNNDGPLTEEIRDFLFTSSLETFEDWRSVMNSRELRKWSWLCRTYVQWHAFAFILSELGNREASEETERAWKLVDTLFYEWEDVPDEKRNPLRWKPLQFLRQKAERNRQKGTIDGTPALEVGESLDDRCPTKPWPTEDATHYVDFHTTSTSSPPNTNYQHMAPEVNSQVNSNASFLNQPGQSWNDGQFSPGSFLPGGISFGNGNQQAAMESQFMQNDVDMDTWAYQAASRSLDNMDFWW